MLTQAQIDAFHQNGFLNGGLVLRADEVDELRAEIARVIDNREQPDQPQPILLRNLSGDDKAPVWQIVNIWQVSDPFRQLIAHPQITQGLSQLTNATELRIWHDQIQYKPAEIGGVNMWHQDAPYAIATKNF